MSEAKVSFKKVRLTKEPERFGQGENYSFDIAVNTGKDDKEKTDFYQVMCFGKVAERYCKPDQNGNVRLKKGQLVNLEGTLTTGEYTSKEGTKVKTTSVILNYAEPCGSWNGNGGSTDTSGSSSAPTVDTVPDDAPPFM